MIRVLVVDDSALMRRVLSDILKRTGDFAVTVARDGMEAMRQLHECQPDVITLDVNMPHMDGLACLDRIMVERPCRVLMVSSLTESGANVTLEAMHLGAIDFIAKPSGAITLAIDTFAPAFVERVLATSRARLRPTLRLTERVRLRTTGGAAPLKARTSGMDPALDATCPVPQENFDPGCLNRRQPGSRHTPLPPAEAAARPAPGCENRSVDRPAAADRVVLVGVSTGGPPALDALLSPLPAGFPWPIVIAQHMPALFTASLARRLDRLCALRVIEVDRMEPLLPGTVYIGKGDADIIVASRSGGAVVMAAPAHPEHRWHPSTDRLVTTAMAQISPTRLVGVLMTGMGNDGAAAMTRLRQQGGHTIAEAEATAVVWGMPGELVRAGGAEVVAPLDQIARQLLAWAT